MIFGRRGFKFGAAAVISGCTSAPLPNYDDALKGLYSATSTSVPVDVPMKASPTIALVGGARFYPGLHAICTFDAIGSAAIEPVTYP